MGAANPVATHAFGNGGVAESLEFLRRTRSELRTLRMVRVWTDRLQVVDVNGDAFQIEGIGYPDDDVIPLLDAVDTVYKKDVIHQPIKSAYKEFKTGRRYAWGVDRVM